MKGRRVWFCCGVVLVGVLTLASTSQGYYHPSAGRFVTRDPVGYVDGHGLYTAYFASRGTDSLGLTIEVTDDAGRRCCDDQLRGVVLLSNGGHVWLGVWSVDLKTPGAKPDINAVGFWPNPKVRQGGTALDAIFGTAGGIHLENDNIPTDAMVYKACPETIAKLLEAINRDAANPPRWSGAYHCGSWATDKLADVGFTTFTTYDAPDQVSQQIQETIVAQGGTPLSGPGTLNVAGWGPGAAQVNQQYSNNPANTTNGGPVAVTTGQSGSSSSR